MKLFTDKSYDEERALYGLDGATVLHCRFEGPADGESALKECQNLTVEDCYFDLRYPFWHVTTASVRGCELTENCRAALWYDQGMSLADCSLHGIKALRECADMKLSGCDINSKEFAWRCRSVSLQNCQLVSEYPFFECRDLTIDGLTMKAKYSFQYVENGSIRNSHLDTKDAFWHARNLTVFDSEIRGEYLGWYSENLKLVRCRIIGTQPLCYCKGLILEDCTMEQTDLAFERSEVQATIRGSIDSIKNPASGRIDADRIDEQILEDAYMRRDQVTILERSRSYTAP